MYKYLFHSGRLCKSRITLLSFTAAGSESVTNFYSTVEEDSSSISSRMSDPTTRTTATLSTELKTEAPKPPNIENLNLMLDPSKKEERKKKVLDAKEKYNQEFGQVDFETAYTNLFEILWYSQLPCFDIRNITSENKDEISMIKRCYWKGQPMSCSSIFLTRPTDRGMCCAFNMEKAENIFRKSKYESALSKYQEQDIRLGFDNSTLPSWYKESGEPKS